MWPLSLGDDKPWRETIDALRASFERLCYWTAASPSPPKKPRGAGDLAAQGRGWFKGAHARSKAPRSLKKPGSWKRVPAADVFQNDEELKFQ